MKDFKKELEELINKHSMENKSHMPDYLMSEMIISLINNIGIFTKRNLDWHMTSPVSNKENFDKKITCFDFVDMFNIEIIFKYSNGRYSASLDNQTCKTKPYASAEYSIRYLGYGNTPKDALCDFFRKIKEHGDGIWIDKICDGVEHFYKIPTSIEV